VAALTWDQVTIANTVTIDPAGIPIELPPPLDEPVRARGREQLQQPNRCSPPLAVGISRIQTRIAYRTEHLRNKLRPILATLEARLGTLNELTQTTPIVILAKTLGYGPQTLEAHARASAPTYVATRLD